MPWKAILSEVEQLRNVGTRLDTLAEQNLFVSEPLTTIAEDVRKQADMLEVLVAIRGPQ
jgi:hypothetical protein